MSKKHNQTSLFATAVPAPKQTGRKYTYTMPHPDENGEAIISKSVDEAYSKLIATYYSEPDNEDEPSKKEFIQQMRALNYYEVNEFLRVSRT